MNFQLSGFDVIVVLGGILLAGVIGYVFGWAEGKEHCENEHEDENSGS